MTSKPSNRWMILGLGVLFALTPFSIDLYLSAFPAIASDLGTTVSRVSLTISLYFIGFAIGQILYGPFLDRYGRKPPIYIGLGVYIAANLGCYASTTFEALLAFRLISALGGSAAAVGAMTMVRDLFKGKEVSRVFSMLMLVLSVSPLLAPSIGSLVVETTGWRALFAFLIVLALVDVVILWKLPRHYIPDPTVRIRIVPILKVFGQILAQRQFRTYVFASALSFAGLFVYVAASPGVFMNGFGVTPRNFGFVFAFMTAGIILGGQLNRILIRHYESDQLLSWALSLQSIVAFAFFAWSATVGCPFVPTMVFMFLILFGCGIISPNGSALAIAPFDKNIGSASSLFGFIELGTGAVMSALFSMLTIDLSVGMSFVIALSTGLAWFTLRLGRTKGEAQISRVA